MSLNSETQRSFYLSCFFPQLLLCITFCLFSVLLPQVGKGSFPPVLNCFLSYILKCSLFFMKSRKHDDLLIPLLPKIYYSKRLQPVKFVCNFSSGLKNRPVWICVIILNKYRAISAWAHKWGNFHRK